MKFTATVGEISRALSAVSGVVATKTTIPILTHVLVEAKDSRVTITGTDLERECTSGSPAEVLETGVEVLPGGILKDLIGKLPKAGNVTIETTDAGRVRVTSGRGRFALSSLGAEDFPEAKEPEGASFKIDAKSFRTILEATVGSVSTESTRYYLCGVFLHVLDGALAAVGLDGHRLCRRSMDLPEGAENISGVIIPTMGVTTILSLLDGIDGDVDLCVSRSRIWLKTPAAEFSTALINGTFPDYQRAIPQFNGAAATFSGPDLCAAVERAATTLPEAKAIGAGLLPTPDGIVIKVGSDGAETAVEHIDAEFHGKAEEVAANAKYLAAMTKIWGDAPIDLHITDRGGPIVFTSKAVPTALYVIMPMRRG